MHACIHIKHMLFCAVCVCVRVRVRVRTAMRVLMSYLFHYRLEEPSSD